MRYTGFFLIVFLIAVSYAQTPTESVQSAIDGFMTTDHPKEALNLLKRVEPKVKSVDDTLQANFYVSMGICYGQMGIADSSFLNLDLAEIIATHANSDIYLVKVFNTRGLVYMGMAKYDESLDAYQSAMKLAEGNEHPKMKEALRKIYGNSGGIYYQLGDLDKAKEVTEKALELSAEINDASSLAYNHLRLALVNIDLNETDVAIENLTSARSYFIELGDTTTLVYAENTLGRVYSQLEDYANALEHYTIAHKLSKSIGDQEEVAFTQISMSTEKLKLGRVSEAESDAREALKFAESKGYANSIRRALNLLYECAFQKGKFKEALEYKNSFMILSDSLNGVELKERVAELETKYETEKIEAENQRLVLENDLKDANLARSRNAQYAIGIGGSMTIILLGVFFTLRNKKLRAEREAQELQVEALKKRFMELHSSPAELAVSLEFNDLNEKLNTPLTEREFDALKLSIEGKSNAEISEALFISVSTVKFHLRNTYSKMGVGNRKEAFQYMLKTS